LKEEAVDLSLQRTRFGIACVRVLKADYEMSELFREIMKAVCYKLRWVVIKQ